MPIYEYTCLACGHHLEALQKMSDAPLTVCPACSQPELSKQVSAAGFRLSGGGWYETDFKQSNKKNLVGEGSKPASSNSESSTNKETPSKSSNTASQSTSTRTDT